MMTQKTEKYPKFFHLKLAAIVLVSLGTLFFFFSRPMITQNPSYHEFVDTRVFLGIPNALDVLTNIFFLVIGVLGINEIRKQGPSIKNPWMVFFVSILLIAPGSAFYHWSPNNFTLVWDRLPMSLAFMALYIVLFSEHVSLRAEKFLPWALLVGISSVIVWVITEDLRFYFWVQFSSFVTVPIVLLFFPSRFTHKSWYGLTLLAYGLAKLAEVKDREVYAWTHELISGHSVKHVLAAVGLAGLWWMVKTRKEVV